jgi:hypothetical protein
MRRLRWCQLLSMILLSLSACGNEHALSTEPEEDGSGNSADADERDLPLAPEVSADMRVGPDRDAAPDVPIGGAGIDARGLAPGEDAWYAELYPCRDDSDCCVGVTTRCYYADPVYHSPLYVSSYLYSRAPGAAAPPSIVADTTCDAGVFGGMICDPYPVQVRCVSGQCVGRSAGASTWQMKGTLLTGSHCGHVDVPDGGPDLDGLFVSDPSTATATSWECFVEPT